MVPTWALAVIGVIFLVLVILVLRLFCDVRRTEKKAKEAKERLMKQDTQPYHPQTPPAGFPLPQQPQVGQHSSSQSPPQPPPPVSHFRPETQFDPSATHPPSGGIDAVKQEVKAVLDGPSAIPDALASPGNDAEEPEKTADGPLASGLKAVPSPGSHAPTQQAEVFANLCNELVSAGQPLPTWVQPPPVGTEVVVHSLPDRPELNGSSGLVLGSSPNKQCQVLVDSTGRKELLYPPNLSWTPSIPPVGTQVTVSNVENMPDLEGKAGEVIGYLDYHSDEVVRTEHGVHTGSRAVVVDLPEVGGVAVKPANLLWDPTSAAGEAVSPLPTPGRNHPDPPAYLRNAPPPPEPELVAEPEPPEAEVSKPMATLYQLILMSSREDWIVRGEPYATAPVVGLRTHGDIESMLPSERAGWLQLADESGFVKELVNNEGWRAVEVTCPICFDRFTSLERGLGHMDDAHGDSAKLKEQFKGLLLPEMPLRISSSCPPSESQTPCKASSAPDTPGHTHRPKPFTPPVFKPPSRRQHSYASPHLTRVATPLTTVLKGPRPPPRRVIRNDA
eukprot:Sspe_Gene.103951::Locus_79828_Transcript_1_1_Confidence_1.000_Length_1771::g.103951::m.103951